MQQQAPPKRLLSYRKLREKVEITRQYLLILEKAGRFPRRVQLGPNKIAWVESEIDAWIDERARERKVDDRPVGRGMHAAARESA